MSQSVAALLESPDWKPIPNRPGRYVSRSGLSYQSPQDLAESVGPAREFPREAPADTVVVLPLDGGGLISYRKLDGYYRHTLNTEEGFASKLSSLGLALEAE